MNLIIFGLLAICSVDIASCDNNEERRKLYDAVFVEVEPPLGYYEVLKMLKHLRQSYSDESAESQLINEVLIESEVSKQKCRDSSSVTSGKEFSGRANQVVRVGRRLQANLCKRLLDDSMLSSVGELEEIDRDAVTSVIKAMIETNGAADFDGVESKMAYQNAQEGTLRYMEKKMGKTLTEATKVEEFNEAFNRLVAEPCERVVMKLSPVADQYTELARYSDVSSPSNPEALRWAKIQTVCRKLRGSDYSSSSQRSFAEDAFANLGNRKTKKSC